MKESDRGRRKLNSTLWRRNRQRCRENNRQRGKETEEKRREDRAWAILRGTRQMYQDQKEGDEKGGGLGMRFGVEPRSR